MFNLGSTITAKQLEIIFLHWNPFKYGKTDFEIDDEICNHNNTFKSVEQQIYLLSNRWFSHV